MDIEQRVTKLEKYIEGLKLELRLSTTEKAVNRLTGSASSGVSTFETHKTHIFDLFDRLNTLTKRFNELAEEFEASDILALRAFLRLHPEIFPDLDRTRKILGVDKRKD